ncbi:MAG: hypothetical protein ACI9LV_000891 [Candidatus Nanohaloarchaea archaeon]|jgi:hypothetical protein
MGEWEDVRDWEIAEAVSDLGKDSYDAVCRDLWMKNGVKLDFFRYRSESREVETRFYHSEEAEVDREEVMNALAEARDFLDENGFRTRMAITTPESIRKSYDAELEGNYFIDPESEEKTIKADIESLLPEYGFSGLKPLEWKD